MRKQETWRPRPESNRGIRICSPLRHHSATRPSSPSGTPDIFKNVDHDNDFAQKRIATRCSPYRHGLNVVEKGGLLRKERMPCGNRSPERPTCTNQMTGDIPGEYKCDTCSVGFFTLWRPDVSDLLQLAAEAGMFMEHEAVGLCTDT